MNVYMSIIKKKIILLIAIIGLSVLSSCGFLINDHGEIIDYKKILFINDSQHPIMVCVESSGKCKISKSFGRTQFSVLKNLIFFPRSLIDLVLNFVKLILGDKSEISAFREIFSQYLVHVFNRALLP